MRTVGSGVYEIRIHTAADLERGRQRFREVIAERRARAMRQRRET